MASTPYDPYGDFWGRNVRDVRHVNEVKLVGVLGDLVWPFAERFRCVQLFWCRVAMFDCLFGCKKKQRGSDNKSVRAGKMNITMGWM